MHAAHQVIYRCPIGMCKHTFEGIYKGMRPSLLVEHLRKAHVSIPHLALPPNPPPTVGPAADTLSLQRLAMDCGDALAEGSHSAQAKGSHPDSAERIDGQDLQLLGRVAQVAWETNSVDWDCVALQLGYKDAASVKVCYIDGPALCSVRADVRCP